MDDVVVGIDAGGSKTLVAAATRAGSLRLFRRARGVAPMDGSDWRSALRHACSLAAAEGLHAVSATVAVPGHGQIAAIGAEQERIVRDVLGAHAVVMHDAEAAFVGAFPDRVGTLVLSGTGSIVLAGVAGRPPVQVGGWSEVFGDEGSAYWIGCEALRLAARQVDGRAEEDGFASALVASIVPGAAASRDSLMGWVYGEGDRRFRIASIAWHVDVLARHGQARAVALLSEAAGQLASQVHAAWHRLEIDGTLAWSSAGGVCRSTVIVRRLEEMLGARTRPVLPPLGGALAESARRAGWPVDVTWCAAVREGLVPHDLS